MKPETRSLLAATDRELTKARKILGVDEPEAAARDAYFAVLFAARALIFEVRNVAPKTHSGAASLFAEIAIKPGLLDERYGATLSQGLHIRMDVDYEPLPKTTQAQATEYVERAAEFVGAVRRLIEAKA